MVSSISIKGVLELPLMVIMKPITFGMDEQIRANDPYDTTAGTTGTTWVFAYDLGGNVLTRRLYAHTDAATVSGLTPLQITTYSYSNSSWKDQLTAITTQAGSADPVTVPITYDTIGNPLILLFSLMRKETVCRLLNSTSGESKF